MPVDPEEAPPSDAVDRDNGEIGLPGEDAAAEGEEARAHAERIEGHGRPTTGPTEHASTRDDPNPAASPG